MDPRLLVCRVLRIEVLLSSPFCWLRSFFFVLAHPVIVVGLVTHPGHPSVMAEKIERPNTLIITVPRELSALPFREFVEKLVSSLGEDNIRCIQFVPKHYVRVTFTSFDARNTAYHSGIFIDAIRLFTVEADPMFKDVYLEHLPNEVPDDAVCEAFRPFGAIHEIVHLKYVGSPIYTGTRLLKVALASDVPVNLRVMSYPCRVFY